MARRLAFFPSAELPYFTAKEIEFEYFNGLALSRQQLSIASMHRAIKENYPNSNILEISTKSKDILGQRLSAFNLKMSDDTISCTVESAYQGSKIFEFGGPFNDIYKFESINAKQDLRLTTSGNLIGFEYNAERFTVRDNPNFYDYLYIKALINSINHFELQDYDVFTDIAFSTNFSSSSTKARNCQARSAAIYSALAKSGIENKEILMLIHKLARTEQFSQQYSQLDFEF